MQHKAEAEALFNRAAEEAEREVTMKLARNQVLLTEAILLLEKQKNAAVDEEDFATAATLKAEIELTQAQLEETDQQVRSKTKMLPAMAERIAKQKAEAEALLMCAHTCTCTCRRAWLYAPGGRLWRRRGGWVGRARTLQIHAHTHSRVRAHTPQHCFQE